MSENLLYVYRKVQELYNMNYILKDEQLSILHALLQKKDSMGILGTGFGKSLTYVLPPLMLDVMYPNVKHISIVISPLKSLMQDQIHQLLSKGIRAASILQQSEMSQEVITGVKSGLFSVVFICPESVNTLLWSSIFRTREFRNMVCLVAIDEAHCVIQWGSTFREQYLRICWLRPVMKDAPFLFLTATCTPQIKDELLKVFSVTDVCITAAVPNRPNIFLTYKSQPGMSLQNEMRFYIDELMEKGKLARKCIIYTRVNPAGDIYEEFLDALRERAYSDDGKRLIDIFVASSSQVAKDEILKEFPSQNSYIRCLIASTAFGMGVDIPDVELVIHWGASSTVLNYWQEVGRAGRDGRMAHAIMFATPRTVMDRRITEDCIRDLHSKIEKSACVRLAVLKCLYLECMGQREIERLSVKEICQNNCIEFCSCSLCLCCNVCKSTCKCKS